MRKLLLKVVIGILAVPIVVFGGLYVTRGIPAVSKYVVAPMARLSQSIGMPVIVMPSDNYFKQEAKEVYEVAVARYNSFTDKGTMIIGEQQAQNHNAEGVSVYQNYNPGVSYAELIIKPYEEFEKEWVEYSKEFYKTIKRPTKQDIEEYNKNVNQMNEQFENQLKLEELNKQL